MITILMSQSKLTRDKNSLNLREDCSNEGGKYVHIYKDKILTAQTQKK